MGEGGEGEQGRCGAVSKLPTLDSQDRPRRANNEICINQCVALRTYFLHVAGCWVLVNNAHDGMVCWYGV
jgi:hypothetical protein